MDNNFIIKSKNLLLKFLREPGGFSFFPSSFFWNKNINSDSINESLIWFLKSDYFDIKNQNNKINLYIHIPFCTKICSYCNCFKTLLKKEKEIDVYLEYLEKEADLIIKLNNKNKIKINTIFIWWWTPNLLSIEQFTKLYWIIVKYFDLEELEQFLLDWHPNYYNKLKLDYFNSIWVNRLTFAIQTFDEQILIENNRDIYDIKTFEENITYLKNIGIKINIDLLIWLKWQTFNSIKNDIDYLNSLNIDNVSVHYLMKSNNINYKLDENYLEIITQTKQYLLSNNLPNFSPNISEDYFASKRNTTISLWASAITNIYSEIIFSKPWITDYYKLLNLWILPSFKWLRISKKDEMIKYIYLNILYWVNINIFNELYWEDIFRTFINEFKFLNNNNVITIKNWNIFSNKTDLETLIYFNIFFLEKFSDISLNQYNIMELNNFFLNSGELIDK